MKFLLLLILILAKSLAWSETQEFLILDVNGAPLIGASLHVQTTSYGTVSDIDGVASLDKDRIGDHDIEVSYTGYKNAIIPNADLNTFMTITINMKHGENVIFDTLAEFDPKVLDYQFGLNQKQFSQGGLNQSGLLWENTNYKAGFLGLIDSSEYLGPLQAIYVPILDIDDGVDLYSYLQLEEQDASDISEIEKEGKLDNYEEALEEILDEPNTTFVIQRLSGGTKKVGRLKKSKKQDYGWIFKEGNKIEELLAQAITTADFGKCNFDQILQEDTVTGTARFILEQILANEENYVLEQIDLIAKPNPLSLVSFSSIFQGTQDNRPLLTTYPSLKNNIRAEILGLKATFKFLQSLKDFHREFEVFFAAVPVVNRPQQRQLILQKDMACYSMKEFVLENP